MRRFGKITLFTYTAIAIKTGTCHMYMGLFIICHRRQWRGAGFFVYHAITLDDRNTGIYDRWLRHRLFYWRTMKPFNNKGVRGAGYRTVGCVLTKDDVSTPEGCQFSGTLPHRLIHVAACNPPHRRRACARAAAILLF